MTQPLKPLLSLSGLTVALPPGADRPHAVENVSFSIFPGQIVCVVGESGSGKSISASALMGLLPPELKIRSGSAHFEGADLLALSAEEHRSLRGRRLGMIFQEPMTALNPLMTIEDQIAEVMVAHDVGNAASRAARVLELLQAVGLPDPAGIAKTYPFRLSGGQRQRVMIAMALALDPALLIADEPTTALDVTTQAQILKLIKELQERQGTGVLFITHDFGVVADIADHVVVMRHGRIVEQGPAQQVLNRPQHDYTRALIEAVPRFRGSDRDAETTRPLVELKNLSKIYRRGGLFGGGQEFHAVRDASLLIRRGETVGVVGESGSGKSTLARCVVRLIEPSCGEILFDGDDITHLPEAKLRPFRRRIQMVFQDPFASLNPRMRIGEILTEGPIIHGVPRSEAVERAAELIALVGLNPSALLRYPHEFSGGQRQRIGIARALAVRPELLIADEPVSALDVSVQAQVLDLLADLRKRLGLTMLFITHDLRVASQVCDRVVVMRRGEIVEEGPTTRVFREPQHEYTRTLLDAVPGHEWEKQRSASGVMA